MIQLRRTRGFYIAVLVLPVVNTVYLIVSGRLAAYWRAFDTVRTHRGAPGPAGDTFGTGFLWFAALAPLLFTAWDLGRQHVAARRLNYTFLVGLREVVRRALGSTDTSSERDRAIAFARPPRDNPLAALAWGLAAAALVPTFFATMVGPELRTPGSLLWLGVTGLLIGATTYCRHRAMAYLRDEPPSGWDMFRQWRLLNPGRYEEAGRVFVRWQIAVSVLLPIWWLGGGAVFAFR